MVLITSLKSPTKTTSYWLKKSDACSVITRRWHWSAVDLMTASAPPSMYVDNIWFFAIMNFWQNLTDLVGNETSEILKYPKASLRCFQKEVMCQNIKKRWNESIGKPPLNMTVIVVTLHLFVRSGRIYQKFLIVKNSNIRNNVSNLIETHASMRQFKVGKPLSKHTE